MEKRQKEKSRNRHLFYSHNLQYFRNSILFQYGIVYRKCQIFRAESDSVLV